MKVDKETKGLLDVGNEVIKELKETTPHGAANQQREVDELNKVAEKDRQEKARIAYSVTTEFYNALWRGFGELSPEHELMKNWYEYFMSLGFKKDYYGEEVPTFNRSNPLFAHLLTAFAVLKMGGAVCAQYAPLTALRLAEKFPDLKVEIGSGGGHSFALVTGKKNTVVVDPWAYAESQKAHLLEHLKEEFQPSGRIVINEGDGKGPTAGKTVPTLSQFVAFMNMNEELYMKTFGIDFEKLSEEGKPEKSDWSVGTTISGDYEYVEE